MHDAVGRRQGLPLPDFLGKIQTIEPKSRESSVKVRSQQLPPYFQKEKEKKGQKAKPTTAQ